MSKSRTSFIQLFVGFLLSVTGTGAKCPIELSPPSVVVKYGDEVSVNCSATEAVDSMGWEAPQGGTRLEEVNSITWHVEELTDWNIVPRCFTNLLHPRGEQCHKDLKVVVYTFPATINITMDAVMIEGEDYHIKCNLGRVAPVQMLSVLWYKDEIIHKNSTFKTASLTGAADWAPFISFTPTRQDDGVKFRCEALLNLGPDGPQLNVSSEELTTTVLFGPDEQCTSQDTLEFLEGETLQSRCPVKGNPTPSVKWTIHGSPVDPNQPIRRENAGPYTIQAEGLKNIKKTVQVLVIFGPELECPSNDTVREYSPHNLTCIVKGYPKPEINWYKDGDEVVLPANPTRSDAGQYLITASNKLSSVNRTVDLFIIYPPSQIVELEDSLVEAGSAVWLKCSSTGNPRPTYSWSYYRTGNVVEENEDGVSRLIIDKANADNMGSYTCQAWNKIGNVSKTVRVTVKALLTLELLSLSNGTEWSVKPECPIKMTPDMMVIQYQSKAEEVTCTSTSADPTNVKEIYWEGVESNVPTVWLPDTQKDWNLRPVCTAEIKGRGKCRKPLDFILYKTPDSVSLSTHVSNSSNCSMENEMCQLQCDIINVAPARSLVVRWYHGNTTIEPESKDSLVTGCPHTNISSCDIRTPVNVSSSITIVLDRKHNKEEFRCEAQLDLGPERPQPPHMWSSPLNITITYKPLINHTRLPKTIPMFRGYPEDLVCEADGNPAPRIQWLSTSSYKSDSENVLTVSEPGFYTCNATNELGSDSHVVEVILKEDYLPLIAGFVAVTVVIISVIFLFIYSIYYKNTKMRRYSLKNPKLSTQTGNVAHNGWDMQFPMTKLS